MGGKREERGGKRFGTVEVQTGGRLVYLSNDGTGWSIGMDEIVVVGEYTNEDGPSAADWFYVFVKPSGEWCELPLYADGFDDAVGHLAGRLGFEPEKALFYRPTFDSRIIWPEAKKGKPLFAFVEHRALWTRLWPGPMWRGLSAEVLSLLPEVLSDAEP